MSATLAGRAALVTGAGSGLGRAISIALARDGATVALLGRDQHRLAAVSETIATSGGGSTVVECDTSNPESVARAADRLSGQAISIVVNNAGVAGPVAPLVAIAPQDWDEVFAVNVRGVYLICRAFLPPMIERRSGDIINIASVTGKRPLAGRTPYAASKMALIGLTATLAHEVGPFGLHVNSLSPGPVSGARMRRNFELEARRTGAPASAAESEFVSRSALKRMVEEDEVAAAVLAMLRMPGLTAADIDLSAGMVAR